MCGACVLLMIGLAILVEISESFEHLSDSRNQIFLVPPYDGIFDQMLLVLGVAALLQRADAIGPVMLQVSRFGLDWIRSAAAAQTGQREVIVQRQYLLNVVETLDILVGFRVIVAAVDVLEHVHVARDVGLPPVRVFRVVPKVNVTEVVRSSGVVGNAQRFGHDDVDQLVPRLHVLGQNDLVRVHQGDVVVAVEVAVQTVVVRNHLVLAFARYLRFEIHVTQARDVGLLAGQRDGRQLHFARPLVVAQHFRYVGMHFQLVEEDFIGAEQVEQFDPLDQADAQVFAQEIEALDANCEPAFLLRDVVVDAQVVGRRLAALFRQRDGNGHLAALESFGGQNGRLGEVTSHQVGL